MLALDNEKSMDAVRRPVITTRQMVLMAMLGFAFLLPFLTWWQAVACVLLALIFNVVVLPQITTDAGSLAEKDSAVPESGGPGMILYPISILALILVFHRHIEVVAASWAILALGDGAAGITGHALGGPRIPWNDRKTWTGFAGFVIAGTLGAYVIVRWVNPHLPVERAFLIVLAGAIVGALAESAPIRLDDNLTVPLAVGGFFFCAFLVQTSALQSNMTYLPVRFALAVTVSAVFSLLALAIRAVDGSGAFAAFFLGIALYMGYGWKSFCVAAAFFVLGTVATRAGYKKKIRRRIAELHGGARSWREALANTLAGAFFSILAITTHHEAAFLAAFVAAFAEAAGDTVSSEIGQWLSPRAYMITTWKPVAAGENGGISFAGSAAGLAASSAIAVLGLALGLCRTEFAAIALATAAAGNILDSLLGATLERRGFLTNGAVNLAGTIFAGALALAIIFHFHLG